MECNRDEAMRAKSIAQAKFEQKDYFSAKKFALKAQNLYPGLDGISHMLTTLDVYISAENKSGGEVDWYAVLAVNPSAEEDTLKKQYRKMALVLHPDKNRSIGADGAFKLISEAWSFLSDKEKRWAYNQRRGIKGFQPKVPTDTTFAPSARTSSAPSAHTASAPSARTDSAPSSHTTSAPSAPTGFGPSARTAGRPPVYPPSARSAGHPSSHTGGGPSTYTGGPSAFTGGPLESTDGSSAPPGASPIFNFTSRRTATPKSAKKSAKVPSRPPPTPLHKDPTTFWTKCSLCKIQYEYLRMYLNGILRCPTCKKPYKALETPQPHFSKSSKPVPWKKQKPSDDLTGQNAQEPVRNVPAAKKSGPGEVGGQKSGPGQASPNSFTYANYQQVPVPGKAGNDSTGPSVAPKGPTLVVITQDTLRKRRHRSSSKLPQPVLKKRKVNDVSNNDGMNSNMAQGFGGGGAKSASGPKINHFPGMNPNLAQEFGGVGATSGAGPKIYDFPGINRNMAEGFGGIGATSGSGQKIHDFFAMNSNISQGFGGLGATSGFGLKSPDFPGMDCSTAQGFGGVGATSGSGPKINVFSGMNHNMAQGFGGFGATSGFRPNIHDFSGMNCNKAQGYGGFGSTSGTGSRSNKFSGTTRRQPDSTRELTVVETQKMLMAKATKQILKKLSEPTAETTDKAAAYKEKDKTKESSKERNRTTNSKSQKLDNNRNSELPAAKIAKQEKHHVSSSKEYPAPVTMTVPDSDFHDFDQDRSESSFGDNEVWAAYDDVDGMPRFYALINKVISRKPFKLRISWLNSKTTTEFSTFDWVGSGFYKTSGEFRVGKYETCTSINSFSQKVVSWSKGSRGSIAVLPKKDDVWAVYRNWSADWNESTTGEVIHKYDMVVVLDDYNEENGVSVAPLTKVVGFRTVFRPNLDLEVIKKIPKEEMFRFSHMVPSHLLTSQEAPNAPNAPKGCLELDPAAVPLELLQMISETNEGQTAPDKGKKLRRL